MLKAKLYLLKQQEQEEKLSGIRGEVTDIAWGNQIRSYVMQPYTMVSDHRTNEERGQGMRCWMETLILCQCIFKVDRIEKIEQSCQHRACLKIVG